MALPTRPATHAAIESAWGQEIHDWTFTPAGCLAHSGAAVTMDPGHATSKLNLDVVDDDPGGFVVTASDQVVIPANRAGVYFLSARLTQTSGVNSPGLRVKVFINGAIYTFWEFNMDSGGAQTQHVIALDIPGLVAGDIVDVRANKIGAGADNQVSLTHFSFRRVASEYGA